MLRDKIKLLKQYSVTDVSVGFRLPGWCPSRWAPAFHFYTKRCKFGLKVCIFTFFLFSDAGLNLLNGFEFYFDLFWMADTENQQLGFLCGILNTRHCNRRFNCLIIQLAIKDCVVRYFLGSFKQTAKTKIYFFIF